MKEYWNHIKNSPNYEGRAIRTSLGHYMTERAGNDDNWPNHTKGYAGRIFGFRRISDNQIIVTNNLWYQADTYPKGMGERNYELLKIGDKVLIYGQLSIIADATPEGVILETRVTVPDRRYNTNEITLEELYQITNNVLGLK